MLFGKSRILGALRAGVYQKIDSQIVSSAQTSFTVSIDGDAYEDMLIVGKVVGGSSTAGYYIIRPNNDSGSNYGEQFLDGARSSVAANQCTTNTGIYVCGYSLAQTYISAFRISGFIKSGLVREFQIHTAHGVNGSTVSRSWFSRQVWSNTADNITSIVFTASQADGIGVGSIIDTYIKRLKI